MNANLKGALKNVNKYWVFFEHKGKQMSKSEVKKAIEYGIKKGYEHTGQLTDEDIEQALKQ